MRFNSFIFAFSVLFTFSSYALEQENIKRTVPSYPAQKLSFEEKMELFKKALPADELRRLKEISAKILEDERQQELERRQATVKRILEK